ncbi:NfeD family protein [Pseudoduganella sp. DS3]|uniref:NfeD family protein n=1 Tax=Pseudoduganella guangdongensis TaxID=2692179 RepID=A0A6N9HMU2_9BURK|nr:NfeD family protein [Pseudoduganella guangdongensis]MYN04015.1 NfeD family protein [Pseudoduganella guangdongensis]
MADWMMWAVGAGVLVALELFIGTFYLLMIAIGFGAGALTALARVDMPGQLLVAALVAAVATLLLRRSRFGKTAQPRTEANPDVNLDIGQSVSVAAWQDGAARVMYRGALWDVELAPGEAAAPGVFKIREVRGSRLIVGA